MASPARIGAPTDAAVHDTVAMLVERVLHVARLLESEIELASVLPKGFKVENISNGDDAMEWGRTNKPSVIILSVEPRKVDARVVAATNRNLTQMMGDKLLRSDLYYRLKVFPITIPPLRDQPEDIPILARHFTKKYAGKMNRQIDKISSDTMRALVSWPWPGNVRELENFIERSVILSRGPALRAPLAEIRADALETAGDTTLARFQREHIVHVLQEAGGVVSQAATRLGLPRTTLNAMMRKLGISRKDL
jgi:transcriptional regulator with GAF, ATPase, and Fis domain